MTALSEAQTRKKKIDVMLKKCDWDVNNRTKVIEEVDTKQSDFVHGKYKTMSQTLKSPEAKAFADYLLFLMISAFFEDLLHFFVFFFGDFPENSPFFVS